MQHITEGKDTGGGGWIQCLVSVRLIWDVLESEDEDT